MPLLSSVYDPGKHVTDEDALCLHRNENLLVDATWLLRRATELVSRGRPTSYPDPQCSALRAAIANMYGVAPDNVYVGNGSDGVLSDLLQALKKSFATLTISDVGYAVYPLLARRFGYGLEFTDGETLQSEQPEPRAGRLVIIDSPNAVTGERLDTESLGRLASTAGSFLVWDNCYGEFAGDRIDSVRGNVAVVRTFSKYFGLAGLRVGYCIAEETLVAELLRQKDIYNVNGFAQVAALEAIGEREYFEHIRHVMLANRQVLMDGLEGMGFEFKNPGGNFLLASHPRYPSTWLQAQLAQDKIYVRHFPQMAKVADYIRITIPNAEGIKRLLNALNSILS